MTLTIGQYVYGYVPYINDCYGIYEITFVTDHHFLVLPIVSRLANRSSNRDWTMPKSAITMVFDTTDLNVIKCQYPELFV